MLVFAYLRDLQPLNIIVIYICVCACDDVCVMCQNNYA